MSWLILYFQRLAEKSSLRVVLKHIAHVYLQTGRVITTMTVEITATKNQKCVVSNNNDNNDNMIIMIIIMTINGGNCKASQFGAVIRAFITRPMWCIRVGLSNFNTIRQCARAIDWFTKFYLKTILRHYYWAVFSVWAKFVLRMRRNCYFEGAGQNSDSVIRLSDSQKKAIIWWSDDVLRCFRCTDRKSATYLCPVCSTQWPWTFCFRFGPPC